jgi:hypothetical protein
MLNTEKSTKWVLSAIIVTSVLGYIFASLGKSSLVLWTFSILGILLGLGLYSEVAIVEYFRQKKYKKIGFGDIFVWFGFIFGTVVILNSIFIIQAVRNVAPGWLLSFLSINGAIAGGVAGLLMLLMLWMPKPD